jgi:hypothetical protein
MKQSLIALCLLFTANVFAYTKIVNSGNMAASITSDIYTIAGRKVYAIHAIYTGSPVGTLTLEASNDGSTWATVTGSSTAVSGASNTFFNVADAGYEMVRLKYTLASGTGTLNAYASYKE